MGYSFDVELSDLSIYEVYDAQFRKLKKLERVEVVGTEKNPPMDDSGTIQKKNCYLDDILKYFLAPQAIFWSLHHFLRAVGRC